MTVVHTSAPIAVIGGGRMGAGIAQAFAVAKYPVVICEADRDAAAAARDRVGLELRRAAKRGVLTETEAQIAARVDVVADIAEVPEHAQLVVEAVPEDIGLKRNVLAAVEAAIRPDCVLATNTSSLPVTEIGTALQRPSRFLGMHFFNPVPSSALVELVVTPSTDALALQQASGWVAELGKQTVVVRDSPGFASSRLGVLLGLEAIRMVEEGVADAESIDRAMELGYRHPMGPLRSTDLVGLDVRLAIAEYLSQALGARFTPPQLLRDKVAAGELGRKAGRGFYEWH